MADTRPEIENPETISTQGPAPPATGRSAEKRGDLTGGAATDAALASSRRVFTPTRGNPNAYAGLQQHFSPREAADLIAAVSTDVPVLDLTAGNGALLEAYSEHNRYAIEIDPDHAGGHCNYITGDVQQAVPMLRAAGARWPALALNPPFGLGWRDASRARTSSGGLAEINSTVAAFVWSLDLMDRFGQGAMICGTDRLFREVLPREEAAGIYAVIDVEDGLFEEVALPCSIAFYVHPNNRDTGAGDALRLSASRAELAALADEVVNARERLTHHVRTFLFDARDVRERFSAVRTEHARRKKDAEQRRAARRHDLQLRGSKVSVGLSAYSKLALAAEKGSPAVREVELLSGQHVSYFGQNPRALKQLKQMASDGLVTVQPALDEAAARALDEAEKVSTPLFPLKPQMRLGWLTDLQKIRCKADDAENGLDAGADYPIQTRSRVDTQTEERLVEMKNGDHELRQFKTERRLLEITVGEGPHKMVLDEGPENIRYLIEHFEIPDPGSVAERFPEEIASHRRLLEQIESEMRPNYARYKREQGQAVHEPFAFKEFQLDHLSRLLTKRRGLLAHEQGLGKSLMQLVLADAIIRLGAENKALFVVPQDLIPQWQRECRKFLGREMSVITGPADARAAEQHLKNGGEGWYITHFEAISRVGREHVSLPERPVDHKIDLAQRLARYKNRKREDDGLTPTEVIPLEAATTRDACPRCGADTSVDPYEQSAPDWDGEVCRAAGCGYVHRSRYAKSGYAHLTTAFKRGVRIIDEVAEIRGETSLRSKSIRAMARGPHFIGGTGTPLSNFIEDAFWPLWACLGNASSAFPYDYEGGKAKFESDFCVIEHMLGRASDGEANQKKRRKILPRIANVSQFWRLGQPSISRCRKEQTGEGLVKRTYYPVRVPMGAAQRRMSDYWVKKENFAAYFTDRFPAHGLVEAGLVEKWAAALGQLWRLETAATLPSADGPTREYLPAAAAVGHTSDYTPAALKVLETAIEHAEKGEKVLIGSDLILSGKWLAERLCEKGIRAVHITEEHADGTVSTKNPRKRSREIQSFVQGDAQVLCCGVGAVKLGHNLDVASTVIVHGLPYSFSVWDQFIARVHRLTSEREVSVYCIIPKGSLAEQKYELLMNKGGASDLAFDGELQVQPEEATDWSKVIEDMRQRGISSRASPGEDGGADPRGEVIDEAEIEAAWHARPPAGTPQTAGDIPAQLPAAAGSPRDFSYYTIDNPHSYEQPALF